ncbi:serine/threonine-protein kinase [Runella aurantiaca]|uniref:Serine/threonine protein kinase n=1 Tax=Runella aurantiaca TaxID=2282308 RepID=A0A369IDI7_9BACT|nr:serine/threonine-protein kinase [Runella aurantiaca]RDB06325.1 serine/threonine protein kinase [Runella aurantiaca]
MAIQNRNSDVLRLMTYEQFKQRYRYDPANDILGEGAFGKVFRAVDTENGSTVAIKVAPVNMSNESHSLKHEFETVGKVDPHLNIAMYDECYRFSVEWAGLHDFAVLEYYPLGSLDKIIKNHSLTDTEKHDLAVGILEGLRHLHTTGAQGVVHRDLKPRNVLIQKWRGKYVPKITDFGLSKFSDSISNSVISQSFKGGTLNYASPEQIKGEQIRRNTDLWSFGVILHEIMTGEVPYKIDDSSESTLRQVYERMNSQSLPESFKNVREPYASIIKKCLMVNPNQRYRAAEEILLAIRQTPTPPVSPPLPPIPSVAPIAQEKADQTEIFEDSPFAGLGKATDSFDSSADVQPLKETSTPPQKDSKESDGYVRSTPKPKKTSNNTPLIILVGVAALVLITASVIYFGGDKKDDVALQPTDSTTTAAPKAVVDTAALALQMDSLFNIPDYQKYAQISLQDSILKQRALTKLLNKALEADKFGLEYAEDRDYMSSVCKAILLIDPKEPKALSRLEKIAKY